MTVQEMINELKKYPLSAQVCAYEGEITGLLVYEPFITIEINGSSGRRSLGEILCADTYSKDTPKFNYDKRPKDILDNI